MNTGPPAPGTGATHPARLLDQPRETPAQPVEADPAEHRQTEQVGDLQHPVTRVVEHLDEPVVGPAADHHPLVGGEVGVGEQRPVHHRVDRDAVLLQLAGERVDDHAEAQQAGRPTTVDVLVADHLGQVDHGSGQ